MNSLLVAFWRHQGFTCQSSQSFEASKWFQWRHNTVRNQANRLLARVIASFSQTRIFDLKTNWEQTVADRVNHSFSKQRHTLSTTRVGITRVSFVIREIAFTYFPIITKLRNLISEFAWLKHCCYYCKETSFFAPQFKSFRLWTRCNSMSRATCLKQSEFEGGFESKPSVKSLGN